MGIEAYIIDRLGSLRFVNDIGNGGVASLAVETSVRREEKRVVLIVNDFGPESRLAQELFSRVGEVANELAILGFLFMISFGEKEGGKATIVVGNRVVESVRLNCDERTVSERFPQIIFMGR